MCLLPSELLLSLLLTEGMVATPVLGEHSLQEAIVVLAGVMLEYLLECILEGTRLGHQAQLFISAQLLLRERVLLHCLLELLPHPRACCGLPDSDQISRHLLLSFLVSDLGC